MRQRGFGLITFLPYIIMAVVGLLAWWQWADFKEGLREEGRAEVRAEWQKERAALIAARDAMVMRWAAAIQTVERVYVERVVERETKFAGIRERAGAIKPATDAVPVPVPPAAVGLLADSANAANAPAVADGNSGAAQAVPAAAWDQATTLTDWTNFAREAAAAYADVYERFILARDSAKACHAAINAASGEK
jgi:hypothetical protein